MNFLSSFLFTIYYKKLFLRGKNSLTAGEKVEFEVTAGNKGPRAVKVKPISE